MTTRRLRRAALSTVAVMAVVLGPALLGVKALAQEAPVVNPGVVPPHSTAYGKTYGEWSAEWWKWVWSIPNDRNPVGDTTGEFAGEGQSGDVWFLAGTWFGMGHVTRTCTVPAGKALFFPIIDTMWMMWPKTKTYPGDPWGPWWEEFYRADNAKNMDAATNMCVEVDGVAVQPIYEYREYRAESPVFYHNASECALLYDLYPFLLKARYGPSVSDGYFVMLAPLPEGGHTIYFHADQYTGGGIVDAQEVTYQITVVPNKK